MLNEAEGMSGSAAIQQRNRLNQCGGLMLYEVFRQCLRSVQHTAELIHSSAVSISTASTTGVSAGGFTLLSRNSQ